MTVVRPQIGNGLHWVRGELDQSLLRARSLIEQHIENPKDMLPLQQAFVELHQVRGTAAMIQCFGVSAVSEEMRQGVHDLMHGQIQQTDAVYSALLGATVQLSDYIDALASGMDDCVLVLHPAINELRLARGKSILTEADLFVAQLQSLNMQLPIPDAAARMEVSAQPQARKLLPVFQAALVPWLKGSAGAMEALARIGKIAEQLAVNAVVPPVYQLWRTLAAVVEALLSHTLEDTIELKRLFGAAGQQIKWLAENGDAAAAAKQGDLAYQLLFYVGRSRGQSPRVSALRKAYQLDIYLPTVGQIEELRQKIHSSNTMLLNKVSEEISADLAHIKDSIDLAVRATGKGGPDLADTRTRMKRVSDILATLGLSTLHRVVSNQTRLLEGLDEQRPPTAELWMGMATAILRVEHSLEDALFRQLRRPPLEVAAAQPELEEAVPHSQDLREGVQALLRESLINLSRLKTLVDAYIKAGESSSLIEAAKMLNEVSSGMLILESGRARMLLSQLERYVKSPGFAQLRESKDRADRFADAIASVEYYIEGLRDEIPNPGRMLDDVAGYVERLDFSEETAVADPAALQPQASAAAADEVDPEIRDIFVEEAGEVRGQLEAALPRWTRDPQHRETLITMRRAFHTLKGSGRMVGANQIGEFGWAVENLLNRCLDGAVSIGPGIMETVQQAVAMLPGLIEDFREIRATGPELNAVIERAHNLAAGRDAGGQAEPDMAAIFREDAREKLALVTQWLSQQDRARSEFEITQDVVRAFHTLRGSALVVEAQAISELSGALETYLDSTRGAGLMLTPAALDLLIEATDTLRQWVKAAGTPAVQAQHPQRWLTRISELQSQVPDHAVEAAADRQLAEVFAAEAFELVQKIEDTAKAWMHAADNRKAPHDLKNFCHTLMGAALMSQCPAIANTARALHNRMDEIIAAQALPDATFFGQLKQILEGVYQQLDRYREGELSGDGSELTAQVYQLQWSSGAMLARSAAEAEIIEMPPVQEGASAAVGEMALAQESAAAGAGTDAELLSIFLAEGQELLENLDAYSAAWEQNPRGTQPANELRRVLHTLKGSARMAGLSGIGEVAHRLESLMDQATRAGATPDTRFFGRLHHVSDGLHHALDEIQRGQVPDTRSLIAELEAPAAAPARPPVPPPAAPAPPAPRVTPPAATETPAAVDAELAEIFAGEAAELLENLQAALNAWAGNPHNAQALRDMQHALHTLKGGARMAGLNTISSAAHEMETRVNELEQSPEAADARAFARLRAELEALQNMHDLLQRDSAAKEMVSAPVPAAPAQLPAAAEKAEPVPPPPAAVLAAGVWDPLLFWRPEDERAGLAALRRETARVPVETLDAMLNAAGEISIYRSRLEEHNTGLQAQLNEMAQAITRLREQLRMMDIETEAQISARGMASGKEEHRYEGDFDPLEMDRYTRMQELSRALSESVGDLANLHSSMDELASEAETLLQQQGRINAEVQTGLMGTLMVPFSRQVARLQRVVKQTAAETGKQAEAVFTGIESELDRNVLERMTAPLEHLLRNAVVHGIEDPERRRAAGKPEVGQVQVRLWREGTQLLIELRDDGKGLDFKAIREIAIKRGLMPAGAEIPDEDVARFIFEPGFSTAKQLTQAAGRGIGMDVVASEVKQLGGTLELGSEPGKGARFLIRLPLTLAISQALLVGVGPEQFAIPLPSIEGIVRIPCEQLGELYRDGGPALNYGGHGYRVRYLGDFIGVERASRTEQKTVNAILVRLGEGLGVHERRVAVVVDTLYGNREVVSKAVGPQVSSVTGVSGATILADGRVVLILDVPALAQDRTRRALITLAAGQAQTVAAGGDQRALVMVVDDSITIRRVTERLLLKHGYRVTTAKDGLDAMAKLQTEHPVTVLLDIEMPRADGFEVAAFIRNTDRIKRTPIIMITSRSGDKHRERAKQIGVNRYMIKPFQEEQLVSEIREVIHEAAA